MDKLDFLSGDAPAEQPVAPPEEVKAEQEAPPPSPPEDQIAAPEGPPRGPDGKFVSQAPAPAPEPAPEPLVKPEIPPGYVPASVVKELRDEIRSLKAAPPAPPPPIPDRFEDPQGFEDYQVQQQQAAILDVRLDISEEMARAKHGDEAVNAAQQWALEQYAQVPGFQQRVLTHRNPYEFVVSEYQRHQLVSELTPDVLAEFKAWKAAQGQLQAQAAAAPAAPPTPAAPPPSIASAPSAGGVQHVPSGPGQAYAAIFDR